MPATIQDRFAHTADSPSGPARNAFSIAPSDSQLLATLPKALLANSDGSITIRAVDSDSDVTITVSAGQIVPVRAAFVRATGTTADVIGLV